MSAPATPDTAGPSASIPANITVRIQTEDFDLGEETRRLRASDAGIGAIASFVGVVRDVNDDRAVAAMELEHYPGMTERAIEQIAAQACERWRVSGVTVVHRVGELLPLDQIVLVVVTSAHRGDAFAACEFIMDFLKTKAPLWKKERTPQGARWVRARASDDAAAERWHGVKS